MKKENGSPINSNQRVNYQESIRSIKGITGNKALLANMIKATDSYQETIRSMKGIIGNKALLANMIKATDSYQESIRSIKGIIGNKALLANMIKATDSYQESIRSIKGIIGNKALLENMIRPSINYRETVKEICNKMQSINLDNLNVNEDGTISYYDQTINVNDDINDIITDVDDKNISYEQKFYKFLEKLKIKNPIIIFIAIYFILNPIYQSYLDYTKNKINNVFQTVNVVSTIENNKNEIIKDIKKEVIKELSLESSKDANIKKTLNNYRFVKIDQLNVRVSDTIKSKIIFNLKFGQVVRVLYKNKGWTLIEYTDNKDIYIRGWVFTRYISNFKR